MDTHTIVVITEEMLLDARKIINTVRINRTVASKIDTLTGIIGEFVFAKYFYGDWKINNVDKNKGKVDFENIEIKTSSFPFNKNLNLLVREDYAIKRKAPFYVQIILDVESSKADQIKPNTKAYICGWATAQEVDTAIVKDMGSKLSKNGGYKCRCIPIKELHSMDDFKEIVQSLKSNTK